MTQVGIWVKRLAVPLALIGYFFLWPWHRDGDPTRFLVFLMVYAAGGVITVLAFEVLCYSYRSKPVPRQDERVGEGLGRLRDHHGADSWGWFWLTVLKVFTFWPWVILIGIVFWLIMVGQRRQNRMTARETPSQDAT